ncbi:MAG: hypothetical protein AB7D02_01350 [Candidatus Paceibacterota bacterium]
MRKILYILIFLSLLWGVKLTGASTEVPAEDYYISFVLDEGKFVKVEMKEPLYGKQQYVIELKHPILKREGTFYIPADFFINYLGSRLIETEEKIVLVFRQGTPYEEKYVGNFIGTSVVLTNPQGEKVSGFLYIDYQFSDVAVYFSERIFSLIGIPVEGEEGKKKITLELVF